LGERQELHGGVGHGKLLQGDEVEVFAGTAGERRF
jgi:hypothetical protein